jgi:hypothetical protein
MKKLIIAIAWIATVVVAYFLGDYFGFRDTVAAPTSHGRFLTAPKTEWTDNGRDMRMVEDFVYVDPRDKPWLAPRDSIVNGASIPSLFWTWIGGPFEGKYRNASIVHDVACEQKKERWKDVHRMFFDACLAGGVSDSEAKRLYWAVARYGPRWSHESRVRSLVFTGPDGVQREHNDTITVAVPIAVAAPTQDDLEWATQYFSVNNPDAEIVPDLER